MINVLMIGGGGREHSLAWKCQKSPLVDTVFVAPGNAGTQLANGIENVPIKADDIAGLLEFAQSNLTRCNNVGLTIVGPEVPIVAGIADQFSAHGLKCFAPGLSAARLEGSKTFAKEFLTKHSIPTAKYQSFTQPEAAIEYAKSLELPLVVKADGLAAGKGVVVAESMQVAQRAIVNMLNGNQFGQAGSRVIVEECLRGEEVSFICMVSNGQILPMASSQDHKAAYDGDTGANTGGMGAYSPAPIVDDALHQLIMESIIEPTVQGLHADGIPYIGFLYAGLMIGLDGIPRVLEFNCRLGDPETQPIMMRLESDIVAHCLAAIEGRLDKEIALWSKHSALGVVLAAKGYPQDYAKGATISGLDKDYGEHTQIFHAGTERKQSGTITSGGRVLCVTSTGVDIFAARERAYTAAIGINWEGCWMRQDIGYRALDRRSAAINQAAIKHAGINQA